VPRVYGSKLYDALGPAGTETMAAEGTTGAVEALAASRRLAVDPHAPAKEPAPPTHYQFFPAAIRSALREDTGQGA
jgi:hypothetical protein